jgi:endosialidase-like protein
MADFATINGSVLLNTDPTNTATALSVSRTDVGMTSASKALAQITMFGAGLNNMQGVLSFSTSNSGAPNAAPAERMRIDVSGNVGIGAASPAVKLAVGGNGANLNSNTDVWVENNLCVQGADTLAISGRGRLRVGGAWGFAGIYSDSSSNGAANDLVLGASSGRVRVGPDTGGQNLVVNGDIAILGKHAFRNLGDGWLRLNQDLAFPAGTHTPGVFAPMSLNVGGAGGWGNPGANNSWFLGTVGVGTTTPYRMLHVHSDNWPAGAEIHSSGATAGFSFTDREAGRQFDNNGAGERWVLYSAGRTANLWTSGVGNRWSVAPNGQMNIWGPYLVVNGFGGEASYIGGDGWGNDVQVGSMNPNVTGVALFNAGNGTRMACVASKYVTMSDGTLKTDVEPIADALAKVRKLRGVTYKWAKGKGPEGKHIGLIAQEVAEVAPEAVHKDSKGVYGIVYGQLVSVLIEATKELEARLSKLEGDPHKSKATG